MSAAAGHRWMRGATWALALMSTACVTAPETRATAEGCARARLAREWSQAAPTPFVGCWSSDRLPGVIVLSELPAPTTTTAVVGDDRPPAFLLTSTVPVVTRATQATWELLAPGLARLSWASGFDGLVVCVEPRENTLAGELRALDSSAMLPSAALPLVLRRTHCP